MSHLLPPHLPPRHPNCEVHGDSDGGGAVGVADGGAGGGAVGGAVRGAVVGAVFFAFLRAAVPAVASGRFETALRGFPAAGGATVEFSRGTMKSPRARPPPRVGATDVNPALGFAAAAAAAEGARTKGGVSGMSAATSIGGFSPAVARIGAREVAREKSGRQFASSRAISRCPARWSRHTKLAARRAENPSVLALFIARDYCAAAGARVLAARAKHAVFPARD